MLNGKAYHLQCVWRVAEAEKRAPLHNLAEELFTARDDSHYQTHERGTRPSYPENTGGRPPSNEAGGGFSGQSTSQHDAGGDLAQQFAAIRQSRSDEARRDRASQAETAEVGQLVETQEPERQSGAQSPLVAAVEAGKQIVVCVSAQGSSCLLTKTNPFQIAKYAYASKKSDELSFKKREQLVLVSKRDGDHSSGWWLAQSQAGVCGLVPSNYFLVVDATTLASHKPATSRDTTQGGEGEFRKERGDEEERRVAIEVRRTLI